MSQNLTKQTGITAISTPFGEVFHLQSLTFTVPAQGNGVPTYSYDTAITLAGAVLGSSGLAVNATGCVPPGGQPWALRWPSTVPQYQGVMAQPYPGGASFLGALQQDGYLQASQVDLAGAPAASWPTNLWTTQPEFGEVLAAQGKGAASAGSLINVDIPGTLYVNLELVSKPGEARWHIVEWNYAFSINTGLANDALKGCTTTPPKATTPPKTTCTGTCGTTTPPPKTTCDPTLSYCGQGNPPHGECYADCNGVTGLPALCHGAYSSVPICLPPGCGTAGLPTCPVADQMWLTCTERPDHCNWPVLIGPVRGKWGIAVRPAGAPAQYIGHSSGTWPQNPSSAEANPYAPGADALPSYNAEGQLVGN